MFVHLFGVVFSPARSNFVVHKTAEDNAEDFSADAINTVRLNFYVDDFLKSLPSVLDAVSHSKWFEPRSISSLYCVIARVRVVPKRTVVGD